MTTRVADVFLLLTLLCGVAVDPLRADDIDDEPKPRLRITDPQLQALLQRGVEQSPSLRALIDRLDRTDVVVYVQCARLRSGIDGQLTFVSAAAGLRYVIVQIAWQLPPPRRIATIGHELQHALEVAAHPAIVDQPSMKEAYGRIGYERERISRGAAFNTAAAVHAGERIWKELTGNAAAAY
jgi:hypothetical protein